MRSATLVGIVLWCVPVDAQTAIDVIPEPQRMKRLAGRWQPAPGTAIVLAANAGDDLRFAARQLADEIRLAGGPALPVVTELPENARAVVRMGVVGDDHRLQQVLARRQIVLPKALGQQGYVLHAEPGELIIAAHTPVGVFYGVQTARQLLDTLDGQVGMPAVHIADWPVLEHRMVQYDFARSQQANVAYVKRMIRQLSRYKINELMFYMEDDYKFAKYPFLGRKGTWTRPMIEELSAYAKQHHLQLVPQIESMGHGSNLLRHDELAHLRENVEQYKGKRPYTSYCTDFCSTAPGIEAFWTDVYGELAEAFSSSDFIHTGLDEAHGFGLCNRCQAYQKEHGNAGLLARYLDMLNAIIRKRGKTMMYWDPWCGIQVHYGDWMKRRPKARFLEEAICFDYEYGNWSRWRLDILKKAGVKKLYVSPGVMAWGCIYPDYYVAEHNIREFIKAGLKVGAMGVCTTTWSLSGGNFVENNWYGFIYTAECAWSPTRTDLDAFDRKFARSWFGLTDPDRGEVVRKLVREYTRRPFKEAFWGTQGERGQTRVVMSRLFWSPMATLTEPITHQYLKKLPRDWPPKTDEVRELVKLTDDVLAAVAQARPKVKRNAITLDFMELGARSYQHVARKLLTHARCRDLYEQAHQRQRSDRAGALERMDQIATELSTLQQDYPYLARMYERAERDCGAPRGTGKRPAGMQARLKRHIARVRKQTQLMRADPAAMLPPRGALGLSAGGPFDHVGVWTPETTPATPDLLRWDVSKLITGPGAYTARLLYKHGRHGINIYRVALEADGKEVCHDEHTGWSGSSQTNHYYGLAVRTVKGVRAWALVARIKGGGGTDSQGDVDLRKEKP